MPETLIAHPSTEIQTQNASVSGHREPAPPRAQAHNEVYWQTEDYGSEPQQYGPETLETVNARSLSDLHTLLVSLPPGDVRNEAIDQLPVLGITAGEFGVSKSLSLTSLRPLDQYALLPYLLDRAVDMVGGEERARTILHYPGITLDQDFEKIRPVSATWLEVAEAATKLAPQIDIVIPTMRGRRMFEDISDRRADWNDVFYGYLDKGQIAHEKDMVAQLHSAFRKQPAMPTGYSHPGMSHVIPDARFGHLWRSFTRFPVAMGLSLADWVEYAEDVSLPPEAELSDDWEATTMDPANAKRLNVVFTDQRFKRYVDTFISLYAAAEEAIDSEEAKKILKDHKEQLNTLRKHSPDSEPEVQLHKLVRQAVGNRIEKLQRSSAVALPDDLENTFMTNIDPNRKETSQDPDQPV
jgi:hypothetical protein